MDSFCFGLSWLGLIFTGFAVLWSLRITYRGTRWRSSSSRLPLWIHTIGWLLILLGMLGPLATLSLPLATGLIPLAIIVAAMAMQRFRLLEFRMLHRQLALALDKGLSLERTARSFACERVDEVGDRAERLAESLDQGMPLEHAMRQARIPVPFELRLATRLGQFPWTWSPPDTERVLSASSPWVVKAMRQVLYLTTVLIAGCLIVAFIFIKIMPTFAVLFQDFDQALPALTQAVIDAGNRVGGHMWVWAPLLLIPLLVLAIFPFYYIGWLNWEPYPLSAVLLPVHSRRILRVLADQATRQRPFPEVVQWMAKCYPRRHVQRRLSRAALHMSSGIPWCAALEQEGLIDRSTRGVLEAAERLGNLPWALREMAEWRLERFARRITSVAKIIEPVSVLIFAAIVAVICVAIMSPLARLIEALT